MKSSKVLTYFCENDSAINIYVFETIFWLIGIPIKKVGIEDNIDIYYGREITDSYSLSINENLTSDKIFELSDISKSDLFTSPFVFEFDFVYSIGIILTDQIHNKVSKEGFDIHNRLTYDYSIQSNLENQHVPLLNTYIEYIRKVVVNIFDVIPLPLWPNNNDAAFILSHDVDDPIKYSILNSYKFLPPKKLKSNIVKYNYWILRNFLASARDQNRKENWLFSEIMDIESSYGFKSTFYFASRSFYDNDAHELDVKYDISSHRIKSVIKELIDAKFEVALHTSYNAHKDSSLLIEEKEKLEQIVQDKVIGNRHHFWSLGLDPMKTLSMHELAGFKYDSSVSFNNNLGYRYNIAAPFYPFNYNEKKKINVLQFPAFLMDGDLFAANKMNPDLALKAAIPYIDQIVKYKGLGAIDWHARTSYPGTNEYNEWGQGYLKILEYLSTLPNIWVTSAQDVYKWLESRSEKLNSSISN